MFGQAVESVSGAGAPSQSSTPHRGGALLQCLPGNYAQAMTRQARRPASDRTLDSGAPLLFRPIAGDAPEVTTTGVPSPAQVAAPLRGRQNLRHSFASRALALSEDLPMTGRLLARCSVSTTALCASRARLG